MDTTSVYNELLELYKAFRLQNYRELFGRIREKDGSLSATEAFAADVVYLLGKPSLSQFAEALGVSQPNATYKANSLQAKGYVNKGLSPDDKRECRLTVSERFFSYFDTKCAFLAQAAAGLERQFSQEELESFQRMLHVLREELSGQAARSSQSES